MDLVKLGSKTAKAGFKNESDVVDIFNSWKTNLLAQKWLDEMGYVLKNIESVIAERIKGSYKADIQVQISIKIKLKNQLDCQNLQVKLVSNETGFNQIDKRWLKAYKELWNIPENVFELLQFFTGEKLPYKNNTKDSRRMFLTEMKDSEQKSVLDFFKDNKFLIVSDILKGRGKFAAEWMLVIRKANVQDWVLKPMNIVINYYSNGDIIITKQGSIRLGKITIQRKGGDNGRSSANMLQFKIDPTELFKI
jgi:hypothetical protein